MPRTASFPRESRRERINRLIVIAVLAAIFLFGGASRADALSQLFVRLIAVAAICVVALRATSANLARVRLPLIFLALLMVIIGWQLIPIPFALWQILPGRGPWAEALESIGFSSWRPASLSPDTTLNSLLALLPAAAVIAVIGLAGARGLKAMLVVILGALLVSVLLSVVQIGTGQGYFYAVTTRDQAVGLFANRNHQAFFLACCLPLLVCWAQMRTPDRSAVRLRRWISICASAAIVPLCLITGSRSGLILLGVAMILSVWLWFSARSARDITSLRSRLAMAVPVVIGLVAIVASIAVSRDVALIRLVETQVTEDRLELLPTYLKMAQDFFPAGSGFGTFDPVYRHYELHQFLKPQYLNQAHNDWVQILIEGGAPAAILILVCVGLLVRRSWTLWRSPGRSDPVLFGRAGSIVIVLLAIASLTDYPLRTPSLSVLFVLSALWMFIGDGPENERRGEGLAGPGRWANG